MDLLKNLNLGIAFFVEIAMLACYIWAGISFDKFSMLWRLVIAIFVPVVLIVIWGQYFAPNNTHRLGHTALVVGKLILFALAASVLFISGHKQAAIVFLGIAYANLLLLSFVWHDF